jgi:uncharacterized phage-associated protein
MYKIKNVLYKVKKQLISFFMKRGMVMHTDNTVTKVNSIDLSKYILKYFKQKDETINHLKLQKLVYYIDAWHNVFLNEPLIEEDFEAWMHGPVVRDLWNHYRDESILNNPIYATDDDIDLNINQEQREIIDDVLEEYGDKTPYYLECLTHEEKPWIVARRGYAPSDRCTEKISKELMKEYYGAKLDG